MNLQRTSTYNLACDFKENIEEVEANWEAELQHLQKNKKARDSLQEKLRILHVLVRFLSSIDGARAKAYSAQL